MPNRRFAKRLTHRNTLAATSIAAIINVRLMSLSVLRITTKKGAALFERALQTSLIGEYYNPSRVQCRLAKDVNCSNSLRRQHRMPSHA
jgi:hypothetical protein